MTDGQKERFERIKNETKLHTETNGTYTTFNNKVVMSCSDFQFLIDLISAQNK